MLQHAADVLLRLLQKTLLSADIAKLALIKSDRFLRACRFPIAGKAGASLKQAGQFLRMNSHMQIELNLPHAFNVFLPVYPISAIGARGSKQPFVFVISQGTDADSR